MRKEAVKWGEEQHEKKARCMMTCPMPRVKYLCLCLLACQETRAQCPSPFSGFRDDAGGGRLRAGGAAPAALRLVARVVAEPERCSAISRLYLGYLSAISWLYLGGISPALQVGELHRHPPRAALLLQRVSCLI